MKKPDCEGCRDTVSLMARSEYWLYALILWLLFYYRTCRLCHILYNGGHLHVDFATISSPVVQQQVCVDEENCGIVQTRAAVLHQTKPHFQNNYRVPRSERGFVVNNAT
jgi:hypothetical protein